MANKYLDNAGGNSAPYESVANAATTLNGLLGGTTCADGEIIFCPTTLVDQGYTAATTFISPSVLPTSRIPQQLVCVSDFDSSPSTIGTGGLLGTTGNFAITFQGNWYVNGLTVKPGSAGSPGTSSYIILGNSSGAAIQVYENCKFTTGYVSTSAFVLLQIDGSVTSANDQLLIKLKKCEIKTGHANQVVVKQTHGTIIFSETVLTSDSAVPAKLLQPPAGATSDFTWENSDLSTKAIGGLVDVTTFCGGKITFHNCKLDASTTVTTGTWTAPGGTVFLINCDDSTGNTNYRYEKHEYQGTVKLDTAIKATTSPSTTIDSTQFSLKLSTNTNASKFLPVQTEWVNKWMVASSQTIDVECLVEGNGAAALNNDDLWIEADYISGSDSPISTRISSFPATILTANSAVVAGTTAWTDDGYATERTHKLSVTFTPTKAGYVKYRVCLGKPSAAVYVNIV